MPKILWFSTFYDLLLVMDNLDIEFVHQFRYRNFRILGRLIIPGKSF